MTIFEQLKADHDAITEDQIEQCGARLARMEEGDAALAVITRESAKRLWALADNYHRQCHLLGHQAMFDTPEGPDRDTLRQRIGYLDALSDAARDLAWAEMKEEAGGEAWKAPRISLRANFTLVSTPEDPTPNSPFRGLAQGLARALADATGGRAHLIDITASPENEPDDGAAPKPRRQRHRKPQ